MFVSWHNPDQPCLSEPMIICAPQINTTRENNEHANAHVMLPFRGQNWLKRVALLCAVCFLRVLALLPAFPPSPPLAMGRSVAVSLKTEAKAKVP